MKETNNIKSKAILRRFTVALMLLLSVGAKAQIMDNGHHVDTLSFAERLTIRTNAVDWVLAVPNIGIEFDIFPQNYNQWSVGVNLRYRPSVSSTNVFPAIFDIFEVSLEGRQYWRERQATPTGYLRPHLMWYDKILSCRNMMPSHPKWIFYRGGYVAYTKYSYFLDRILSGRQGTAYQAGFTWGFTTPLYNFTNGNSLSLECGVSVGAAYTKESKYRYDKRNNIYYYTQPEEERDKGQFCKYPVLKDLHVALAYHFGDYPIQKKYRWRYDADLAYRDIIDSLYLDSESKALTKYINDSIYDVVYADFRHVYDSVLVIYQKEDEEEALARTAQKKLELKAQLDSLEAGKPKKMTKEERKAAKAAKKAEEDSLIAIELERAKKAAENGAASTEGGDAEATDQQNAETVEQSNTAATDQQAEEQQSSESVEQTPAEATDQQNAEATNEEENREEDDNED